MNGNHERIFIALATLLFNPWIAGIILSAILAAVMSTLSCQLLVCSSAITEDFYKGFLRKKSTASRVGMDRPSDGFGDCRDFYPDCF